MLPNYIQVRSNCGNIDYLCTDPHTNKIRLLLTMYAHTHLASLESSTKKQRIRMINQFYDYCYEVKSENLERIIVDTKLEQLSRLIDGFFSYLLNSELESYKYKDKVWNAVRLYLEYSVDKSIYNQQHVNPISFQKLDIQYKRIKQLYKQLKFPKDRQESLSIRSLSDDAIEEIFRIIAPDSKLNPFNKSLQKRNFIIIYLMLFLGLRTSECLVLTGNSLVYEDGYAYLKITYNNNDFDDRSEKASIKTPYSHRIVGLPEFLYLMLQEYMAVERKSAKSNSGYIFTSNHNKPISIRQLRNVVKKIEKVLTINKPGILSKNLRKESLSAHDLRHTAARLHLEQFYEQNSDMDMALQKLRALMGWSPSSTMPQKYARFYIEHLSAKSSIKALNKRIEQFEVE